MNTANDAMIYHTWPALLPNNNGAEPHGNLALTFPYLPPGGALHVRCEWPMPHVNCNNCCMFRNLHT